MRRFASAFSAHPVRSARLTHPSTAAFPRRSLHSTPQRFRQQQQSYQSSSRSQTAFHATLARLQRWAARPYFYYEVGGLAVCVGAFYTINLETVDISGRRRFNIFSDDLLKRMSSQEREQVLASYRGRVLPDDHPLVLEVARVLDRLRPHAHGMQSSEMRLSVIAEDQPNAFVTPGGDVFVFTGILPWCKDADGIAAVLGHEIGHTIAKHAAEKMSQNAIIIAPLVLGAWFLGFDPTIVGWTLDLGVSRPGSRAQESEADYIGLRLMAEACYDPNAAVRLWRDMRKRGSSGPQFLSTHPSDESRERAIEGWLAEAMLVREGAGCAPTEGAYRDFRQGIAQFA